MEGQERGPRIAGARNPKTVKLTIYIAPQTEKLLEAVADELGHNKGTTASVALSLGLQKMKPEYLATEVPVPVPAGSYVDETGHHLIYEE